MSFTDRQNGYFVYLNTEFFDTFHNRISAIVADAFYTVVGRSLTVGSRQAKLVCDFILDNLGNFQVLDATWEDQIFSLWYEASRAQTGERQDYMVSVLTEIQSYFFVQTMDHHKDLPRYIECLYPQVGAKRINEPSQYSAAEEEETFSKLFDRSFIFHETTPGQFSNTIMSANHSWVIPWMIVSHMDRVMLNLMVESISALTLQQRTVTSNEQSE